MIRYSKVGPEFWTGETGRKLRESGSDTQLLALYLITGPNANMFGLYNIPLILIAHHLATDLEGASKGLRRAFEGGFCDYDHSTETVWVPSMAEYQIGPTLSATDNRHKQVITFMNNNRKCKYIHEFWLRYKKAYNLPEVSPFEGASKGVPDGSAPPSKPTTTATTESTTTATKDDSPVVADRADIRPILTFACSGKPESWTLTQDHLDEWIPLYPGIDILAECRKAKAWNDAQAAKKTAKGMTKFLVNWFNRATNTTQTPRPQPTQFKTKRELDNEFMAKQMADAFPQGGQT